MIDVVICETMYLLLKMNDQGGREMICKIRKWDLSDAADLAATLSNKKVQDNLRDGLPYPYTEQDGADYYYPHLCRAICV